MLHLLKRTNFQEETLQAGWELVWAQNSQQIKSCYSEQVGVSLVDEFLAKILLVNGGFLLKLLLWSYKGCSFAAIEDERNFMTHVILGLRWALALLEIQIPFLVL